MCTDSNPDSGFHQKKKFRFEKSQKYNCPHLSQKQIESTSALEANFFAFEDALKKKGIGL